MFSTTFAFIFLLQPASAPTSQPATPPPAVKAQPGVQKTIAPTKNDEWKTLHRGAPFTMTQSTTMDELAKVAPNMNGKTIRVDGTVKAVCRKKGCWMTLSGQAPTSSARITFKDYGFFVPLKCAGSTASVEGILKLKTLSEGERAHLAQDAGKKVTEVPKHELRIVASSVKLTRK